MLFCSVSHGIPPLASSFWLQDVRVGQSRTIYFESLRRWRGGGREGTIEGNGSGFGKKPQPKEDPPQQKWIGTGYSAIRRFWAKGHSESIHWASQRKPVRSAISGMSSALYLCELSVQMVSSSSSKARRLAAGMCTLWRHVARKCISMRRSAKFQRASWRKQLKSKSAPSSRLMRASKFRLKAAVTP